MAAALIAVLSIWFAGRRAGRQDERLRSERKRADDMERIAEDMAESGGDRPDRAVEWLRRFGGRK